MVAGWGKTNSYGPQSPALREAAVQVMSTRYCNNVAKTVSSSKQKEIFRRVTDDYDAVFYMGPNFSKVFTDNMAFSKVTICPIKQTKADCQ